MARRSVLLLVAVLIALVGTAMIVLYVQGIDARATKGQELVEVLVATETIDTGETVTAAQEAGKFEKTEVRRDDLVDGALSSTSLDLRPGRHRHDLPGRAAHRQEVRQPRRHPDAWSSRTTRWPSRSSSPTSSGSPASSTPATRWRSSRTALDPVALLPDGKEQKLGSVTRIVLTRVPVIGVGTTSVTSRRPPTDEDGARSTEEVAADHPDRRGDPGGGREAHPGRPHHGAHLRPADRRDQGRRTSPGVALGDILPEIFRGVAVTAILEPDAAQRRRPAGHAARLRGVRRPWTASSEHIGASAARVRRRASARPSPARPPRSSPQWARVHRPDLGVILLRHDGRQRRPRARPAQRHARGRGGPRPGRASPRPCSVRAASPTPSARRMMDEAQAAAQTPRRGRRRGRRGRGRAQAEADAPRARSSPSSPPRAASARAWSRPTSPWRWPSSGQHGVPGRPRRQQRRRRDHAAADPAAHDQRPGRPSTA